MKKLTLLFLLTQFAVSAFPQSAVSIDTGFSGGVNHFEKLIPKGTKLVVLNFRSSSSQLSEYIMEELTVHFVNSGHFTVVDRSNLDLLQNEMAFQLSGEVSDETALSIGKMLGAHTIVSGSIELFGDIYRLRIRAIAVESAAIQGIYTTNILRDRFLTSLSGTFNPVSDGNVPQNSNSQSLDSGNIPPLQNPRTGGSRGSNVTLPDYLLSN
jgi:TolB-like protein